MSAMFPQALQKMVLIVRVDIKMSQGKIAAQCAHAALTSYLNASQGLFNRLKTRVWLMTGQPKIVLQIPNEKELLDLADQAKKAGLNTYAVRDAGRTQLKPGTITVLGIGPNSADRIDSITSHLKLL